jgi:predicted DNA-binding protein YlxM (UPF0122 family)
MVFLKYNFLGRIVMQLLDKSEYINLFNSGLSIKEISEITGIAWSDVYKNVDGIIPTRILTEDEKLDICELYVAGLSCPKLADRYRINRKCIENVLNEYDIKRSHKSVRKYTLNENYFDVIDTPRKAYILGLLYADGYNCPDKSTVRLQLQDCDVDILLEINEELNSNKPLTFVDCSRRLYGNGYVSKNMYSLDLYSKHMCNTLSNLGVVRNKSLVLSYPSFLPNELHRHFIRGYFDGDGSLSEYSNKKGWKPNSLITFTSTKDFCEEALRIIRENIFIGGNIYDASNHNGVTKIISICGNNQCKKLLDWMYKDSDMFIKRKYALYKKHFYNCAA